MKPNIAALRQAVEWAEAEHARGLLSEWDQENWRENYENVLTQRLLRPYWTDPNWKERRDEMRRQVREQVREIIQTQAPNACGTTYCIAGKICHDAGFTNRVGGLIGWPRRTWNKTAIEVLRIDPYDAARLFQGDNTIEDIRRIAEEIAAKAGETL